MLPKELFHYSENEVTELKQDFHDGHREKIPTFGKPHGLWFSVEDYTDDQNWKTWCESEDFRLEHLKYKYRVGIRQNSDILLLSTPEEIVGFGLKYAGNDPYDFRKTYASPYKTPYIYWIKWDEIMEKHDGIIIAPYQWSCRMPSQTMWYYGWDCASGCVWNMSAIEEFKLESISEAVYDKAESR